MHSMGEDFDQTGRKISVFDGRSGHFVGFVMLRLNIYYLSDINFIKVMKCKNSVNVSTAVLQKTGEKIGR